MKKTIIMIAIFSITYSNCTNSDNEKTISKEMELKAKELELREKELDIKERELSSKESKRTGPIEWEGTYTQRDYGYKIEKGGNNYKITFLTRGFPSPVPGAGRYIGYVTGNKLEYMDNGHKISITRDVVSGHDCIVFPGDGDPYFFKEYSKRQN